MLTHKIVWDNRQLGCGVLGTLPFVPLPMRHVKCFYLLVTWESWDSCSKSSYCCWNVCCWPDVISLSHHLILLFLLPVSWGWNSHCSWNLKMSELAWLSFSPSCAKTRAQTHFTLFKICDAFCHFLNPEDKLGIGGGTHVRSFVTVRL